MNKVNYEMLSSLNVEAINSMAYSILGTIDQAEPTAQVMAIAVLMSAMHDAGLDVFELLQIADNLREHSRELNAPIYNAMSMYMKHEYMEKLGSN